MNAKVKPIENEFVDLDLSVTKKRKIRFDGDNDRVVEVDIADMGILSRIKEIYPKLEELQEKSAHLMDDLELEEDEMSVEDTLSSISKMSVRLDEIDLEMRNLIDELFKAPVSKAAVPSGTMYDMHDGSFTFAHVIATVMSRYTDNITKEYKRLDNQIQSHTAKYTKGKK